MMSLFLSCTGLPGLGTRQYKMSTCLTYVEKTSFRAKLDWIRNEYTDTVNAEASLETNLSCIGAQGSHDRRAQGAPANWEVLCGPQLNIFEMCQTAYIRLHY